MGRTWIWTWLPFLAALSHQGFAATIPAATVTPTSVITVTSTYSNTVTNTITSILPVTTVETTCTPGTLNPILCANTVWSENGNFWQEWCTTASLEGSELVTLVASNPFACQAYCNNYKSCSGANWGTNLECTLLKDITSTAVISQRTFAAIERLSTNPCVVTLTDSSTLLSTATTVLEYTTTYTSTITLSTSASPLPTDDASSVSSLATPTSTSPVVTPNASACTVSALPTTTDCVDGYYVYNGDYYQVLCSDTVQGYSGFLPNAIKNNIWSCIEVCSTYSNCVGTFWFLNTCYSESGSIDYRYIPYDYSDPDNNVVNYIATRLDSNPCATSTSSVASSFTVIPSPSSTAVIPSTSTVSTIAIPSSSAASHLTVSTTSPQIVSTKSLVSSSVPVIRTSPIRSMRTSTLSFSSAVSSATAVIPSSHSLPFVSSSIIAPQEGSSQASFSTVTSSPSRASSIQFSTPTISPFRARNMTTAGVAASGNRSTKTTTIFTTETLVIETTICSATATRATTTQSTVEPISSSEPQMTTSTLFTTQVHAVTACPSWVSDCPASAKTTLYTTEIVPLYTTICPVASEHSVSAATTSTIVQPTGTVGQPHESLTTSTVFTAQVHTMSACPQWYPHCVASQMITYFMTETVAAYTTICPVTAKETDTPAAAATTAYKEQPTGHQQDHLTTSTVYITKVHPVTACPSSVASCASLERTTHLTTETLVKSVTVFTVTIEETAVPNAITNTPVVQPSSTGGNPVVSTITTAYYTTEVYTITEGESTHLATATFPMTTTLYITGTATEPIPTEGAIQTSSGTYNAPTNEPNADNSGVSPDSQSQHGKGTSTHPSGNGDTKPGRPDAPWPQGHSPHGSSLPAGAGMKGNNSFGIHPWANKSHSASGVPSSSFAFNHLHPTASVSQGSEGISGQASATLEADSAQFTGAGSKCFVWVFVPLLSAMACYLLV